MPPAANGLWYNRAGSGEPVVLLHAGVVDSRIWSPVVPLLARRLDVLTFDQRAYGRSAAWSGPYSLVDDVFAVMDEVGFDRAALVGLSRGGGIALESTLAKPERVTSLVLVAAALPGYTPKWELPEDFERRWEDAESAGDYAAMAELDLELWAPIGVDDDLRAMFHENARASNADDPAVESEPPAAQRLAEIRVPTLVITASDDVPAFHEVGDVLERGIPGARRLVIPNADHMVPWRDPHQLADAIAAFLSG